MAGAAIASTFRYALVAVARAGRANTPTYVALGVAVALPIMALLFRDAIASEGAHLGGMQLADEFDAAAGMIAVLAGLVGILQIALLLGRALETRAGEYRLLEITVMSRRQLLQTALWESTLHAAIGWIVGAAAVALFFAVGHVWVGFPRPSRMTIIGAAAAGVGISIASAFLPGLGAHFRRALHRAPSGKLGQ